MGALKFRWVILGLGIAANLTQGVSYSGSVIAQPLLEMVGIYGATEIRAHWATLFSLGIVFLPLGMIIAGWLSDTRGPRVSIALGTVIFVSGLILASFATSYVFLCITFGLMTSLGTGMAYGPIIATAVRWFPERRGLASGLVVGALGFSPVLIAPFFRIMLENGFDPATILQCLGGVALIAMGAAALFITSPPSGFQGAVKPDLPKPSTPQSGASQTETQQNPAPPPPTAVRELYWTGMIRTTDFWILFLFFALGTMPGLMLLSQAQEIVTSLGGFDAVTAAFLIAILAVANATGRVLWGAISDYLGRINTLTVMFTLSAIAMATLPFAANPILFITVILVIGTTFGGNLGLFPSFSADSFGLKNVSLNYAILVIAFATSALISPRIYALMENPHHAFYIAATFALLGAIGTVLYRIRKR